MGFGLGFFFFRLFFLEFFFLHFFFLYLNIRSFTPLSCAGCHDVTVVVRT